MNGCQRILWVGLLIGGIAAPLYAQPTPPATEAETSPASQPASRVALQATWYAPRAPQQDRQYPVAVVLASADFAAKPNSPWIRLLWNANLATVVLQPTDANISDPWSLVRPDQVIALAQAVPPEVQGNSNSLVLLSGRDSGPLAMGLAEAYWRFLAGLVLINVPPVETAFQSVGRWTPPTDVWRVPMWAVLGSEPQADGQTLVLWRKLKADTPNYASLTIDPRPAQNESLLPDATFASWLKLIVDGKRPGMGPDAQAVALKEQYAQFGVSTQQATQTAAGATPDQPLTKKEGPIQLTLTPPAGWIREKGGERPYNPRGTATDEYGRPLSNEPNPFCEMYIRPGTRSGSEHQPFARVFVRNWTQSASDLLDNTAQRMLARGVLMVVLERWEKDEWACQAAVTLTLRNNQWDIWPIVMAAQGGTPLKPSGSLIMVMDLNGTPEPGPSADILQLLMNSLSTKVENNLLGQVIPTHGRTIP